MRVAGCAARTHRRRRGDLGLPLLLRALSERKGKKKLACSRGECRQTRNEVLAPRASPHGGGWGKSRHRDRDVARWAKAAARGCRQPDSLGPPARRLTFAPSAIASGTMRKFSAM